ncbi:YitT family ABC transporter [Spiroplasma sp. BIUS-1]|uniref:YitT family ABC transporter n=1 Tax=Spiroplasma sp. BIUS-1 TaxID=216964 RepID=UPI001396D1CF|nr:YitT family ABC transporter [Spiroplasma sp. BIUS-1]QHX36606.1 YitT family protein [Spiroplasma sp. BIUS-1]
MEPNNLDLTELSNEIAESVDEMMNDETVEFQSLEEKKSINKLAKELNKGLNIDGELLLNFENKVMSQREQRLLVKQYFRTKFIKDFFQIVLAAFLIALTFDYFISVTGRAGLFPAGIGAIARFFATLTFPGKDQVNLQSSFYFVYYFIVNIPLFIFGYFKLGRKFTFTTFLFVILQIGFDQIFQALPYINPKEFHLIVNFQLISGMPGAWNTGIWLFIFGALGGILLGFSYSIVYKIGSSTGGLDFLTVFISNRTNKPVGSLNRKVNLIILACVIVLNTLIIPMSLINSDIKIDVLQNGNYIHNQKLLQSMWDYSLDHGAIINVNGSNVWDPSFAAWFGLTGSPDMYINSLPNSLTQHQYNYLVEFACKAGYGDDLSNVSPGLVAKIKILFIFGPSLFASFTLVMCAGMATNHFYPKYTVRTYMITTNMPKEINKMLLENGFQNDILTWDSINRINGNYLHRSVLMVAMSVMDWDKIERQVFMADPLAKVNAINTKSVKGLFNYEIKKNDDRDIIRTKIETDELEKEKIRQIAIVRAQRENEKLTKKQQKRKQKPKKNDQKSDL